MGVDGVVLADLGVLGERLAEVVIRHLVVGRGVPGDELLDGDVAVVGFHGQTGPLPPNGPNMP